MKKETIFILTWVPFPKRAGNLINKIYKIYEINKINKIEFIVTWVPFPQGADYLMNKKTNSCSLLLRQWSSGTVNLIPTTSWQVGSPNVRHPSPCTPTLFTLNRLASITKDNFWTKKVDLLKKSVCELHIATAKRKTSSLPPSPSTGSDRCGERPRINVFQSSRGVRTCREACHMWRIERIFKLQYGF